MRPDQPVASSQTSPRRLDRGGFTLVELLAVICILSILLFLALPNFAAYRRQVSVVVCMGNMRNITKGLHGYLHDNNNVWPQCPAPNAGPAWEDFWLGTLKPYGITDKTWRCPEIGAASGAEEHRVHYNPTMFPAVRGIATRWSKHPWLIERGPGHGQGALICLQDGSIKSFDKVLAELGVR